MDFVENDGHSTQRGEPSMQMKLWVLNMFTKCPPPVPPDIDSLALADLEIHPDCRLQWDPGGEDFIYYASVQP